MLHGLTQDEETQLRQRLAEATRAIEAAQLILQTSAVRAVAPDDARQAGQSLHNAQGVLQFVEEFIPARLAQSDFYDACQSRHNAIIERHQA